MDEILSALACIPVRTCSYAEWLGIGMALKDAGYECAVWDDWSRDDKRYVEGDCARRWATFKGSERPITVRTIRAMARKNGWVSAFTDFEDTRELAPTQTLIRYLEAMFQPDELVNVNAVIVQAVQQRLCRLLCGNIYIIWGFVKRDIKQFSFRGGAGRRNLPVSAET